MSDHVSAELKKAVGLHQQGKLVAAARHYRLVLEMEPRQFDALHLLGVITAQQGQLDEAIALLEKAVQEQPNAAEALNNLGMALNMAKRHAAAVAPLEKAIAFNPNYAAACNNLGNAYHALGQHQGAMTLFQRACALKPDYAEALSNLGAALHSQARDEEAIAVLSKALSLNSGMAEAHGNLGAALMARNRPQEALAASVRATSLEPGNAVAQAQLGSAQLAMGHMTEAREAFQTAVGLDPDNPSHYASLVRCYTVEPGDTYLAAMQSLERRIDTLTGDGPIELHFALAKSYTDIADHERAFLHLLRGNALKRRTIQYDEASALGWFARIRATFSADLMRQKSGLGFPSQAPIFILGMMRSGSTLVEQILASHPQIAAAGERPYFHEAYSGLGRSFRPPLHYPEMTLGLDADQLRRIGQRYVELLAATASGDRITDKMPSNFATAGLIHLALPNARIIHTRRNPVDTCLSAFSKHFSNEQPFAYDLGELGRYYRAYDSLMDHWRQVLPDGTMLEVQYEELVEDFEAQARHIISHCGLEWDDACLSFHTTSRPVRTASAAQVRQPLYRSSIKRWRPDAKLLEPLLAGLEIIPRVFADGDQVEN
ncbi:MAG: sulfotransferase [Alphaproteobacteria bacterium]|nr:sulfotransferase [Alphaproteobacteria bacterium]